MTEIEKFYESQRKWAAFWDWACGIGLLVIYTAAVAAVTMLLTRPKP